jgi:hypothetical protein
MMRAAAIQDTAGWVDDELGGGPSRPAKLPLSSPLTCPRARRHPRLCELLRRSARSTARRPASRRGGSVFVRLDPAGLGRRDDSPRVPGDLEDDEGDGEADEWIGSGEAEGNEGGAGDDGEGDEAVDAGVVSVGDQRGAVEAPTGSEPDLGGDLVADEADDAHQGKYPWVGQRLVMQESLERLVEGDASGEEDDRHDGQSGELLAAEAAKQERTPQRDGGERVAEVMDQVGQERDGRRSAAGRTRPGPAQRG